VWIFSKPIEQLQAVDLEALITSRARENIALEFKGEMYGPKDADIREMLRDITSIANAEGGVLILGIEEDDEGGAIKLRPIRDAEVQANRLLGSCASNIAERIPGLRAVPVPIQAGHAIVVRIPRSYRRPHMITFGGAIDFWIRHDRQKARMSIAEIRSAITTTEDLAMRAERFIADRRRVWMTERAEPLLAIMATPLALEEGRIDTTDQRLISMLREPPRAPGAEELYQQLLQTTTRVTPTLRGRGVVTDAEVLEVSRTGQVEFILPNQERFARMIEGALLINGHEISAYLRNFLEFISALRILSEMSDPYLLTLSMCHVAGSMMNAQGSWIRMMRQNVWEEHPHLFIGPIIATVDDKPGPVAKQVADRLWNAFHFERSPYFDQEGKFLS
jgi:hypothetical protein